MLVSLVVAAPSTSDLTVGWGTAAPALGLLIVAIAFNISNQRTSRRDIRDLKRENVLCNYRQLLLYDTLALNGIRPPPNFWAPPPEGVAEMNIAEADATEMKRQRARFDLFSTDDDEGAVEWQFLVGVVALILVATLVLGATLKQLVVDPLNDRLERVEAAQTAGAISDARDSCVASLTADYFAAIGNAATLGRSGEASVVDLQADLATTTDRVRRRVAICADGLPDVFVPRVAPPPVP